MFNCFHAVRYPSTIDTCPMQSMTIWHLPSIKARFSWNLPSLTSTAIFWSIRTISTKWLHSIEPSKFSDFYVSERCFVLQLYIACVLTIVLYDSSATSKCISWVQVGWVRFNVPLDTLQVILETVLQGYRKQMQVWDFSENVKVYIFRIISIEKKRKTLWNIAHTKA